MACADHGAGTTPTTTLDAGDSHLSWDSVRLMITEMVPYPNQNGSGLDAESEPNSLDL